MSPIILKANIDDLATLNSIAIQSKMYWNYPKAWIEKWRESLTLQPEELDLQQIYKCIFDKKIVGFCAIREEEESYQITNLWLSPDNIGKGLGKFLLQESIQKVVVKNKKIIVEADPNAEAFYQKQGFVTFDKVESYPKGRFLPLMEKSPIQKQKKGSRKFPKP